MGYKKHTNKTTNRFKDSRKHISINTHKFKKTYGVATISRLLEIVSIFCRIQSLLQGSFAKVTCNFKEPTNRSHPISTCQKRLIHSHIYEWVRSISWAIWNTPTKLHIDSQTQWDTCTLTHMWQKRHVYTHKCQKRHTCSHICQKRHICTHICQKRRIHSHVSINTHMSKETYLFTHKWVREVDSMSYKVSLACIY